MRQFRSRNNADQIKRSTRQIPRRPITEKQPDLPLKIVLAKLRNVQQSGDGWSARCPAHADSNNSLSIGEGLDGQVLMCCHAGCTFEEIAHMLDMHPSAFFKKAESEKKTIIRKFRTLGRRGQHE